MPFNLPVTLLFAKVQLNFSMEGQFVLPSAPLLLPMILLGTVSSRSASVQSYIVWRPPGRLGERILRGKKEYTLFQFQVKPHGVISEKEIYLC